MSIHEGRYHIPSYPIIHIPYSFLSHGGTPSYHLFSVQIFHPAIGGSPMTMETPIWHRLYQWYPNWTPSPLWRAGALFVLSWTSWTVAIWSRGYNDTWRTPQGHLMRVGWVGQNPIIYIYNYFLWTVLVYFEFETLNYHLFGEHRPQQSGIWSHPARLDTESWSFRIPRVPKVPSTQQSVDYGKCWCWALPYHLGWCFLHAPWDTVGFAQERGQINCMDVVHVAWPGVAWSRHDTSMTKEGNSHLRLLALFLHPKKQRK